MQSRVLAIAILFLTLAAEPTAAGEKLSGSELANLFPGSFQAVVSGLIKFKITASGGGSLSAVSPRGKKDRGEWSIQAGKLCIRFDKWLGGRTSCTSIVQEADWYIGSKVRFRRV
jgi:hypothetical protein